MKKFIQKIMERNKNTVLSEIILFNNEPAPREPGPILALAISMIFSATFRGIDYIFLPQQYVVLTAVESAAPIKIWGLGFLIAAVHCAIGRIYRKYSVVIIGHGLLTSLYFSLGVGYIEQGVHNISSDYLRNGVTFIFVVAGGHAIYTYAMWRRWDSERRLRV